MLVRSVDPAHRHRRRALLYGLAFCVAVLVALHIHHSISRSRTRHVQHRCALIAPRIERCTWGPSSWTDYYITGESR